MFSVKFDNFYLRGVFIKIFQLILFIIPRILSNIVLLKRLFNIDCEYVTQTSVLKWTKTIERMSLNLIYDLNKKVEDWYLGIRTLDNIEGKEKT